MHKISTLFKNQIHRDAPKSPSSSATAPPLEMNHETILRFRKQRGVNLGSWFVLEHWITDDPFRCAHVPGQSDLDVVRGADARRILEERWDTWIRETDFAWLAQRGVNTVRIPIGYYHICGADPSVLKGTAFHDFGYVYGGAWSRITGAIELAEKYGMGVLIGALTNVSNIEFHLIITRQRVFGVKLARSWFLRSGCGNTGVT